MTDATAGSPSAAETRAGVPVPEAASGDATREGAASTGRSMDAARPTILVIDNYDSFVYNLVQLFGDRARTAVRRNDAVDLADIRQLAPDGIVLSPGPGHPTDAGVTPRVFDAFPDTPILGVCLGHQALCAAHGAQVTHAPAVVHGKSSPIRHDGSGVFVDLPERFAAGRYHSLAVERPATPAPLVETAWTVPDAADRDDADRSAAVGAADGAAASPPADGLLMGVRHRDRPHVGVQFHPESVLTGDPDAADLAVGRRLLHNFCAWSATGAPLEATR
jgi:anthranilate synthase component 2